MQNIIGQEAGKSITEEYLHRRGRSDLCSSTSDVPGSSLHAYVKPRPKLESSGGTKKPSRATKEGSSSNYQVEYQKFTVASNEVEPKKNAISSYQESQAPVEISQSRTVHKGNQNNSKKKKAGKVVSLAEAAKGSIVFQQGKPCSCQARQHRLVSNCLSCGKIVCEQEGEGPCSFCSVLVLREGSTYAGLEESYAPLSDAEAAAEAYAKRLVDYDRNSAARTAVIDDQSDYYEIEGNSWLSNEEKELIKKKQEEIEEAERAKRNKVVVTFDLVGRKVLLNKDEVSGLEMENRILRPPDEREANRIKPNPTVRIQPIFLDPGPIKKPVKNNKQVSKSLGNGLCLEVTGRVQHDNHELKYFEIRNQSEVASSGKSCNQ